MEKNFKTLQLFYAAALADSVYNYSKAGLLDSITEEKYIRQKASAPAQLKQLGINTHEELFNRFSEIFGCIKWDITREDENTLKAVGQHCVLCNICRGMHTSQPCYMYCINPFKALVEAIDPDSVLEVKRTLWDSDRCEFVVRKNEQGSHEKNED